MIHKPAITALDSVFYLPSTGEDHSDEWPIDRRWLVKQLPGGRKMLAAGALALAATGITVVLSSAWPLTSVRNALVAKSNPADPENTGSIGSGLRPTLDAERP